MQPLHIYICNIRSFLGKVTELVHVVKEQDIHIVMIQESWLDASVSKIDFPNFQVLSRRDRSESCNRGGILTLVRDDINNAVCIKVCDNAERCWHLIQRDTDSLAICNWYLPPGDSLHEIESLREDLTEIASHADTILIAGDLNVHQKSWLKYSSRDSIRGERLKDISENFGLKQFVDKLTRGEYLLDLGFL